MDITFAKIALVYVQQHPQTRKFKLKITNLV